MPPFNVQQRTELLEGLIKAGVEANGAVRMLKASAHMAVMLWHRVVMAMTARMSRRLDCALALRDALLLPLWRKYCNAVDCVVAWWLFLPLQILWHGQLRRNAVWWCTKVWDI